MGYFVTVSVGISVGAPLVGGLLTQYSHWSMVFWINLPIGIVAMLTTNSVLKRLPVISHPHRLDFVGAALMMAASLLLLLALTWGGVRYRVVVAADRAARRGLDRAVGIVCMAADDGGRAVPAAARVAQSVSCATGCGSAACPRACSSA